MTPPSILPWFELVCKVREVEDEPDSNVVAEKVNVPVTSGRSEQHKKVCVESWTNSDCLTPPMAFATVMFQLPSIYKDTVDETPWKSK